MKKVLSIILLALISITAVFGLVACDEQDAGSVSEKGIRIKSIENGYRVVSYVDDGKGVKDLDILAVVKQKTGDQNAKVLEISEKAFSGNDTLESIIVPNTVTKIGAGAFAKMTKLKSLTVPFIGKTAVADIELDTGLNTEDKSVDGERTFGHFFGTEEYKGGSLMTTYYNTTSSNTTYVPATLNEINVEPTKAYTVPTFALAGLTKFTVNFGANVVGLGDKVFYNANYTDNQVYIPSTITTIHATAFEGFTSKKPILYQATSTIDWTKIELPENVTAQAKAE